MSHSKLINIVSFVVFLAIMTSSMAFGGIDAEGNNEELPELPKLPILPDEKITRIIYKIEYNNSLFHVVADPDSLQAIESLFEFNKKERCLCAHSEELWLEYSGKRVRFSICSHCLNLIGHKNEWIHNKMPDKLWKSIQAVREKEEKKG
ncbi:MAG: hypothetical protein GY780_12335 [bacterium]|nr:hypothetical protein [bacterium]